MSFDKNQEDFPLPVGKNRNQNASNFLPKYFRTDTNRKFLNSTIDQMTTPGVIEKIDAYAGRRYSKASLKSDSYLSDTTDDRTNYQFEPYVVYKDDLDNVEFSKDYIDYIGVLNNFRGSTSNHSLLNSQEFYSWNPHIDWDKFTNFREYYWLPFGPQRISVTGQSADIESTYTVGLVDDLGTISYVFSPDGTTRNPSLTLYRGQTYRFEIDTPGFPLTIAILREFVDNDPTLGVDITEFSTLYKDGITSETDYVENGVIEFTVPSTAPDSLYYVSENDPNVSGLFVIKDIEENSFIDVEQEILGKKNYKTSNGVELSNGMKLFFRGTVLPEKYQIGNWYVEGVGSEIRLVSEQDLEVPAIFTDNNPVPFDSTNWDTLPFDDATNFAGEKDYITINRASADRNPWSRYNRWFHKDVIEQSAKFNNQPLVLDQDLRAKRPIIEFEPGLKLFQHGSKAKANVDLVDDFTNDVFSIIEGSIGYNVDGIDLAEGMRVLFTADPDVFVNGKIYEVKFITHLGQRQIALVETVDSDPIQDETVLVLNGVNNKGKMFYYTGTEWDISQEKTGTNQQPLFDLYDQDGTAFNDEIIYPDSTFKGNKIFSYQVGDGVTDPELNFPLSYRNISNLGDIVYDFDLLAESFTYQPTFQEIATVNTDVGYIKKYNYNGREYKFVNGWTKADELSKQAVIRQYFVSSDQIFPIDVFDNSSSLTDLKVTVFLNGIRQKKDEDYRIENINDFQTVIFNRNLNKEDRVLLKCYSSQDKNENGFYEVPNNLERNPLNENVNSFTLGEVNDHVDTIVENLENFEGTFPGKTNLRDLGTISQYGRKFVQHSGPLNLALYHLTDKNANIVNAIRYAKQEYSKFKRVFINYATEIDTNSSPKDQVDLILSKINKDRIKDQPFYFSDMIGFGSSSKNSFVAPADGPRFVGLETPFDLLVLSERAVYVYVNNEMLIHEKDYVFSEGFVHITKNLSEGDLIEVFEYDSTNGSFIPQTPTKLGIFPCYEPLIYEDTSYQIPRKLIQGHDGSIILAYDDYRDDLILDLEKRIFNNIKGKKQNQILDLYDFIGGRYRDTGIKKEKINQAMLSDFSQWLDQVGSPDFTDFSFWNRDNPFTYNYSSMIDSNDNRLTGFWRSIFKEFYDTDRPHLCPWEMIGFTIKPDWWEEVYGPAPYTSNNTILWQDLENGIVREPGKTILRKDKFKRPGLMRILPVNENGELSDPLNSGIAKGFVLNKTRRPFRFGDHAPVETAWRRSSDYCFSLLIAWILTQPCKVFGLGFDTSRIERDITGNIIYTPTGKRLSTSQLEFPSVSANEESNLTSGLVNYVCNFISSYRSSNEVSPLLSRYKTVLSGLDNQLGIKLGGFADKEKLKLVLDSRTPLNKGNIFIPEKNYQIVFNKTSVIETATFSGIIIEKTETGFLIRGYDRANPLFKYNKFIERSADPAVTAGGISESFVRWDSDQEYPIGTVVEFQNTFYRSRITHRSGNSFDESKFSRLVELPVVGGASAILRTTFSNEVHDLPYGSAFRTIQEVVDFLIGYDSYLRRLGFKFDYFNNETGVLEDMQLCIKEFLFWTTQNWDNGTVIAISPVANKVSFERDNFVVDDIYDSFYGYRLIAGDGNEISKEFSNIFRDSANQFGIKPIGMQEGIYLVKLPLVQKEHLVLIDNVTEFNDVIYDKVPGYRQERIRIVGYRTANWNGGLNIPGFFYDDATVTIWEPWKDYAIGDLVKYKEFYYSANKRHTSSDVFNANLWTNLRQRPEPQLFPNWDYRTNQFADFYDLDSDNFDIEQQRLAQHLIGYQKRDYLANIIVDDVSQYKFYQGYIREKGTLNSLTKLFDALSSADKSSLEFYEEWAIRLGQYGAVDNITEIEYTLDESKLKMEPQPIELTDFRDNNRLDLVYEIPRFETYLKPFDYDHKPFKLTNNNNDIYSRDSGYARPQDIDIILNNEEDILNLDIEEVQVGSNLWILEVENSWNVYRLSRTSLKMIDLQQTTDRFTIFFNRYVELNVGDFIGIDSTDQVLSGFYKVESTGINSATFAKKQPLNSFSDITEESVNKITILTKRRFRTIDEVNNDFVKLKDITGERIWLDTFENNDWAVLDNNTIFSLQQEVKNPVDGSNKFSKSYSVNKFNTVMVVGSPLEPVAGANALGVAKVYTRPSERSEWVLVQSLSDGDETGTYSSSVAISPDSEYIAISAPESDVIYTYKRENTGLYSRLGEIVSSVSDNSFGSTIMFRVSKEQNLRLFASSPNTGDGVIFVYENEDDSWILKSTIDEVDPNVTDFSQMGSIYDVNEYGDILVTVILKDPGNSIMQRNAMIYREHTNGWELDQRIDYFDTLESFGSVIAINDEGNKIAIGAPKNDVNGTDNGCVYIYKQENGSFVLNQTIFSPFVEFNEMFGDFVDFSRNKLIISSKNGDFKIPLNFDEFTTSFDKNSTQIVDTTKNVGKVYIYQEIADQFIYAEDLNKIDVTNFEFNNQNVSYPGIEKIRFKSVSNLFINNNHIYLGLTRSKNSDGSIGSIIDCRSARNSSSWEVVSRQQGRVDINQFKRCFVYSKSQNKILSDLDVIDPRQGKIPAPAEQEISFKTFYDPAIYSNNLNKEPKVVVDSENAWSKEHVGRLWWNLSSSSWFNPYQSSTLYRSSKWNELTPNSQVQICEWVETNLTPSEWRRKADTSEGFAKGISGQPIYENDVYSERRIYDKVNDRFVSKYYFWVANSAITPISNMRSRSALEVSQIISSPETLGYRFVAPLSENSFAIHNVKGLIEGTDSVIHFTLQNDQENKNNIHSEYQLLTEGVDSSQINSEIEQKWIDSLVGYDQTRQPVPDMNLSLKERYGVLNFPRQGMFKNRVEAVKQFVERVNGILIKNQISDTSSFANLNAKDQIPNKILGKYDEEVESRDFLRFVSVAKVQQAELEPAVENGRIVSVNIVNPGRGYKISPSFTINSSTGSGAILDIKIDSMGKISEVIVKNSGKNYSLTDSIVVRRFSVLIINDENFLSRWSIVEWNNSSQEWSTLLSERFDTTRYWNYVDWYQEGITGQTLVNYSVDQRFELYTLNDEVGDIVKVKNSGTGGWILLQKVNNIDSEDVNDNYQVVGRENGTIQISSLLYEYVTLFSGYDVSVYDTVPYDNEPIEEFRNIIKAIKQDLFVGDLSVEWNKLFFASIRYILSEQLFVDWIFKTSFVKATHNLGNLDQKINFQNDNLESYEAYVNEVKPYSTKIREYVSSYQSFDNSNSMITDFDLPPSYDPISRKIEVSNAIYNGTDIIGINSRFNDYPFKNWVDNVGFDLVEIKVVDPGEGYITRPIVTIGGNNGATAKAYLAKGKVNAIEIDYKGSKLLEKPEITIEGSISENGRPAKAIAVMGNSVVRSPSISIKFDRVSSKGLFDTIQVVEEFSGTGAKDVFDLKWPIDKNISTYKVYVDDIAQLSSEIEVGNIENSDRGFSRVTGFVRFTNPPADESNVRIEYQKDVDFLTAIDRINFFYEPTEGMPGKDISQLMSGVEYEGVIVQSFDFGSEQGWDVLGWGGQWDTFNVDDEGSFLPPSDSFDTALSGGEFDVLSAAGVKAGEIVVDGDDFVTPTTSKGPEELVPGQIGDTLDMKVYHRVSEGLSIIASYNFVLDGVKNVFSINDLPITESSVIVKINNHLLDQNDYSVDYNNKLLTLNSAGNLGDRLSILILGSNGSNLLDIDSFVFDGSTASFVTSLTWTDNVNAIVTRNGNVLKKGQDYVIEQSDENDEVSDRIKIVFDIASLQENDLIQFALYNSEVQTFSQILIDNTFDSDGVNNIHRFDQVDFPVPFNKQPVSHNILVKVDNQILVPGYAKRYITTSSREYSIDKWQFESPSSIKQSEILVFADGEKISSQNYVFDSSTGLVRLLRNDIALPGSELEIYIVTEADYFSLDTKLIVNQDLTGILSEGSSLTLESSDSVQLLFSVKEVTPSSITVETFNKEISNLSLINNEFTVNGTDVVNITGVEYELSDIVTFKFPPAANSEVSIYQFSNHDINDFARKNYDVVTTRFINPNDPSMITKNLLAEGIIELQSPSISAQYVWIALNGILLTPNVDYILENSSRIKLEKRPSENDRIDIIQFRNLVPVSPKFGYRLFKDIIGRTHFKRLNESNTYILKEPLNFYDIRIVLEDTKNIEKPNKKKNIPGVVFIEGERIEYFEIKGNTLRQLRRGTLGTGIKEEYSAGTKLFGQGKSETVAYLDKFIRTKKAADGSTNQFDIGFDINEEFQNYVQFTGRSNIELVDFIEVFVSGHKLRKKPLKRFDATINQDSPEADIVIDAEYEIDSLNNKVVLKTVPIEGTRVDIVKRQGKIWNDAGKSLVASENQISKFLRGATIELPK